MYIINFWYQKIYFQSKKEIEIFIFRRIKTFCMKRKYFFILHKYSEFFTNNFIVYFKCFSNK